MAVELHRLKGSFGQVSEGRRRTIFLALDGLCVVLDQGRMTQRSSNCSLLPYIHFTKIIGVMDMACLCPSAMSLLSDAEIGLYFMNLGFP